MSFNATFVKKKNQPWISPLRKLRGKFKNQVIWFTIESRAESSARTYYVQGCACLPTGGSCVVVRKGRPSREDLCHSHTQGSNTSRVTHSCLTRNPSSFHGDSLWIRYIWDYFNFWIPSMRNLLHKFGDSGKMVGEAEFLNFSKSVHKNRESNYIAKPKYQRQYL